MSDEDPFGFAFGEGASEEFKERLKEMMRAQREAMEEIQAEGGGQIAPVDRFQVITLAVQMSSSALAAMKPVALTAADVPAELIEKERSVASAKAAESGKPAEIVGKMIEGSVQKYLKEVSLFNQPFVKNDKQTVEQMLKAANTQVKSFTLYVVGEGIEKKVDDFAAEVAAQVAAAKQNG